MNKLVSIIIPVYNVEKTIERCLVSLLEQDYQNIEYIVVNDCTPDNSMKVVTEVVNRYPNRSDFIKSYSLIQNSGVSAVRAFGISHSTGDYIIQCDSDDYCEKNMISSLIKVAVKDNSDVVIADYFAEYANKQTKLSGIIGINTFDNNTDYFHLILGGYMRGFFWNKLIRRSLLDIGYFDERIIMWEDLFVCIQLFAKAKEFSYIKQPFYHYCQTNEAAATKTTRIVFLDSIMYMLVKCKSYLLENNLYKHYKNDFLSLVVKGKFYWLLHCTENKDLHSKYLSLYPESNSYIFRAQGISLLKKFVLYLDIKGYHRLSRIILYYFNVIRNFSL